MKGTRYHIRSYHANLIIQDNERRLGCTNSQTNTPPWFSHEIRQILNK